MSSQKAHKCSAPLTSARWQGISQRGLEGNTEAMCRNSARCWPDAATDDTAVRGRRVEFVHQDVPHGNIPSPAGGPESAGSHGGRRLRQHHKHKATTLRVTKQYGQSLDEPPQLFQKEICRVLGADPAVQRCQVAVLGQHDVQADTHRARISGGRGTWKCVARGGRVNDDAGIGGAFHEAGISRNAMISSKPGMDRSRRREIFVIEKGPA